MARQSPDMSGWNLVDEVTCAEPYNWTEHSDPQWYQTHHYDPDGPLIVAYDTGIKRNILRMMTDRGLARDGRPGARCPASEVLALNPAGIFLSNGPGDPAAVDYMIDNTKRCSARCRSSASAWGIKFWRWRWAAKPRRCASGIAAATSRSRTC